MMLSLANPRQFPLGERLQRWHFALQDQRFEKRFGLELSQLVPQQELVSSNQDALSHAKAYMGVWCRNVRTLVQQGLRANPALRQFVDLGSGKGQACFCASIEHPFERIVGVEFSEPLVETAQRNLQQFEARHPGAPIEFVARDAGEHRLAEAPTLVFMFNPFDEVILQRFLQLNHDHFVRHRSLVAYANDVHRSVLRQQGFDAVYRDPARALSLFAPG
jgi:SAM-dependent methyltransferase